MCHCNFVIMNNIFATCGSVCVCSYPKQHPVSPIMEPVAVLPTGRRGRAEEVDLTACFICQNEKLPGTGNKEKPHSATEDGLNKFKEALKDRVKYHDVEYIDTLDRFQSVTNLSGIMWHSKCYSSFTHKGHLQRLKTRFEKSSAKAVPRAEVEPTGSQPHSTGLPPIPADWKKCIFCQAIKKGKDIHEIQYDKTSEYILNLAQKDRTMSLRLAGIIDLMAAEGKYHLKCYTAFTKQYRKTGWHDEGEEGCQMDSCFNMAMDELRRGMARGEIYALSTVWDRYCEILEEFGLETGVYRSGAFREK